jgi:periodic tryptophan protein 2
MTAHIYSLTPTEGFTHMTLSGHRDSVLGAWFSNDSKAIYTVSKDGALFHWRYATVASILNQEDSDEEMEKEDDQEQEAKPADQVRWRIQERHYFLQAGAKVKSCAFHEPSNLLVVGFSSGIFGIWELPAFTNIHTLRYVLLTSAFPKRKLTQLLSTLRASG